MRVERGQLLGDVGGAGGASHGEIFELRIKNYEVRSQETGDGRQETGDRSQDLGFGIWDLEFWIWSQFTDWQVRGWGQGKMER